jgi:hypothetical protein
MNPFTRTSAPRAGTILACAAAAGLVLGACSNGGSGSSGGSSGSGAAATGSGASSTKSSTSGTSSAGSGNSGTGSTTTVASGSVPFPIAVGNTWIYDSDTTTLNGMVTNKIVAEKPVSSGTQVTMSNHDSFVSTTTDSIFIFHPDGSISYPFSQLQSDATVIKGGIILPSAAVIDSGRSTTSTLVMEIHPATGASQRVTSHITVKGDGTATVTVPAGTYTATVVSMTEKFTVDGYHATIVVKSWMANGVGPVQSEAELTELGHSQLVSELKLKSFTKG